MDSPQNILVIGATGQLGHALLNELDCGKVYGTYSTNKQDNLFYMNITDKESIYEVAQKGIHFETVIITAALTNVDLCEEKQNLAYKINVEGIKNIIKVFKDSKIIFMSTYYVFNGKKFKDYLETDKPCPLNYYGKTKVMAEEIIKKSCKDYLILRLSKIVDLGYDKKNMLARSYENIKNDVRFDAIGNQFTNLISAISAAKIINKLIPLNTTGIINIGGCSPWSNYGLIYTFAKSFGFNLDRISLINSTNSVIRRPLNCVLSTNKLTKLGISVPNINELFSTLDHEEIHKTKIKLQIKEYYEKYMRKKINHIPISGKKFDEKELYSVLDALLEGWWTDGKITKQFEQRFNSYLGTKNTVVVNSGSSANLLALKALTSPNLGDRRLLPDDEVITVAAAFPTTINPIIQCGCIPVFCDVDLDSGTYNINTNHLKKAITNKTKAIFLAHTLGNPFNLKEVKKLCKQHNLWLIEDACDALGSTYDNKMVGTFGDLATYSFFPAHICTMAEGGAVVTDDSQLAKIVRSMRDWGRTCYCGTGQDNCCGKRFDWQLGNLPHGYDHKYTYSEIGYNLKNTDLNVAIGLAQMDKLEDFIKVRRRNFKLLREGFEKFNKYFYLPEPEPNSNPSWFGFLLTLREDAPFDRTTLMKYLTENKIGVRLLFGGNIIHQPYFVDNDIKYRIVDNLDNSDYIMNNTFWIGVSPLISEEDINIILSVFDYFIKDLIPEHV